MPELGDNVDSVCPYCNHEGATVAGFGEVSCDNCKDRYIHPELRLTTMMNGRTDSNGRHIVLNLSESEAESVWTHLDGILSGAGDTLQDSDELQSVIEKTKRQL